jgi:N6-L-threonylcarbamoyladenine synthase
LEVLPDMIQELLAATGLRTSDLSAVAATAGPGLIGGLIVGSGVAKGMAVAAGIDFIPINHLEAHALTARLPGLDPEGAPFPYLLLLVSGGHCQCVLVEAVGRYRRLGGTVDDAVGEAFDKVAKMLGLPWPGGPALEQLAATGNPAAYQFPRPMFGRPGCDFSFSGLKTAAAQAISRFPDGALPLADAANIAGSFQAAVASVLADRVGNALRVSGARLLVVAGGVAANQTVRAMLAQVATVNQARLLAPPLRLCTDNAVMIAWAAIERLRVGAGGLLAFAPRPRWPLDAEDMRFA